MLESRLHIFKGPRAIAELMRGRRVEWSAVKDTRLGEIAFFYHAAPTSAIVAIGRATEDARPDPTWGALAWFERTLLRPPLTLKELRSDPASGRWPVWRMLSRTTAKVPPSIGAAISRLIVSADPEFSARPWLQPFLDL